MIQEITLVFTEPLSLHGLLAEGPLLLAEEFSARSTVQDM